MPNKYEPTPEDIKKAELAREFQNEMDLAFFVVNLQMCLSDYHSLTETEKIFIRKAHEQKFISDTTWLRNAVLNAEANANRGKNKKFIELFPKRQSRADKEYNENAITVIEEMEQEQGKSWVDKIYQANGMKKPISEGKE